MFSTITSGGELQIWDIGVSTTRPRDSIQVIHEANPGARNLPQKEAVNKVMWSRDGRQVVVGDSKGVIHVVPIDDRGLIPKQGSESRFKEVIGVQNKKVSEDGVEKKGVVVDDDYINRIISQKPSAASAPNVPAKPSSSEQDEY